MEESVSKTKQEVGRIIAGLFYDSQEVRISAMNRIRDVIRKKVEGIEYNEVEKKKKKEDKYKGLYVDRKLKVLLPILLADKKITQEEYKYTDNLLDIKNEAEKVNERYKVLMEEYINNEKVYTEFLKHIRGISIILSTRMIKIFGNCKRFPCISALWSYTGYGVVDGHAPKRKKGEQLNFSIKLRSFVWNISDSFVKQRTAIYRDIYDKERLRQNKLVEKKAENAPANQKQADLRARRKIAKLFLSHYWVASRELNGLSVKSPYVETILNHKHIISWKEVVAANKLAALKTNKVKRTKVKAE